MDDFDQFCFDMHGKKYDDLSTIEKILTKHTYKIELLDAEIEELKAKISALENQK